jgi:hypothetical protein
MPTLTHKNAIREYYEQVKDQYPPDLTYEQFEEICKSPFKAAKYYIKSNLFPIINFKNFGKMFAPKYRIKKRLEDIEGWYRHGAITEEQLIEYRKVFGEYYEALLEEEKQDELNRLPFIPSEPIDDEPI